MSIFGGVRIGTIAYDTPEGFDVLTEVKKCVLFCRDKLA